MFKKIILIFIICLLFTSTFSIETNAFVGLESAIVYLIGSIIAGAGISYAINESTDDNLWNVFQTLQK